MTLRRSVVLAFFLTLVGTTAATAGNKAKIIVLPLAGSIKLDQQDADYLHDSLFEAASINLYGHMAIIPKEEAKRQAKTRNGLCNERCALQAAQKTDAGLALLLELSKHDGNVVGFVKLLDTSDQTVLSAKRFIANSLSVSDIEAGMRPAARYVLSAQFLPLSEEEKAILAAKQGRPQATDVAPPAPRTPAAAAESTYTTQPQPQPQPAEALTMPEPEVPLTPEQMRRRGIVMTSVGGGLMALGIGLGIGSIWAFTQAKKASDNIAHYRDLEQALVDAVQQGTISATDAQLNITYYEQEKIPPQKDSMRHNNTVGTALVVASGVSLIGGTVLLIAGIKNLRSATSGDVSSPLALQWAPVIAPSAAGGMLTLSF